MELSPKEEVQAIASKGGQSSHSGGFASMDPDKQVCILVAMQLFFGRRSTMPQHDIASQGGKASATSASDNPGNFANR